MGLNLDPDILRYLADTILAADLPDTDVLDLSETSDESYQPDYTDNDNDNDKAIVRAELVSVGIYV